MAAPEQTSAEEEGKNHTYFTNKIPWFVYVLWVFFAVLFISYLLLYFLPALQREYLAPP